MIGQFQLPKSYARRAQRNVDFTAGPLAVWSSWVHAASCQLHVGAVSAVVAIDDASHGLMPLNGSQLTNSRKIRCSACARTRRLSAPSTRQGRSASFTAELNSMAPPQRRTDARRAIVRALGLGACVSCARVSVGASVELYNLPVAGSSGMPSGSAAPSALGASRAHAGLVIAQTDRFEDTVSRGEIIHLWESSSDQYADANRPLGDGCHCE